MRNKTTTNQPDMNEYLSPGTMLMGQYRILETVGEGGMGVIYRAVQESVGRDVAVKVLRSRFARNEVIIRRFENEARIISQLRHPNTIRLYDCRRMKNGSLFIVTEYLNGYSLLKLLRQGPLPLDRVMRIIDQVCGSLAEAHARGVVHRDLKPENIFLDRVANEDHVKVLDFGIAKLAEDPGFHTQPDILIGTPAYMAPEQASGEGADARSDIYALGIMLFEMIAGDTPFHADTPVALLVKQIREPPPSLRAIAPEAGVSAELEAFVMQLLAKSPEERPKTVDEVRDRLREIAFRRLWSSTPLPVLRIAESRAAQSLSMHPDLVLDERIEITPPPPEVDSLEIPLTLRHPSLRFLGAIAFVAACGAAAAWFFDVTGRPPQLEGRQTNPVIAAPPPMAGEPRPAPDPKVISAPEEEETASAEPEANGNAEANENDDDELDRAVADHLAPAPRPAVRPVARPAARPVPRPAVRPVPRPAVRPVPHQAVRPEPTRVEAVPKPDLDAPIERLVPARATREPPPRKSEGISDGPMPVDIE